MTMNLNERIRAIRKLQDRNAESRDQIEQRETAIGEHIRAIKAEYPDRWQEIVKERCNVSRSRAYEYIQMADGKPVEAVRHERKKRQKKARQNKQRPSHDGQPSSPPKLTVIEGGEETLLDRLDKENLDAPFLAYAARASDSWQLAEQAATCLPGILEQTKPCADDWKTMVELTRKAADKWTELATKVEAMAAPSTRRTKRILAA